jgi:methylmalonyl-CoA mutase
VQAALDALTASAESGEGNLMDLSIKAIRLRATVGEVSDALEKGFRAPSRRYPEGDRGVRSRLRQSAEGWEQAQDRNRRFRRERKAAARV